MGSLGWRETETAKIGVFGVYLNKAGISSQEIPKTDLALFYEIETLETV
jgi:hypothetical protein